MAELIVALDLPTRTQALDLVAKLPELRWVKVGPVLFVRDGPRLVGELQERGLRVFLDLKWHDIPHTVARAVEAANELGVELATVHTLGGRPMLAEAVKAAGAMRIAAVSVLTSHASDDYWEAMGREDAGSLSGEVERLVRLAAGVGVGAIVTSPREVEQVAKLVDPGCWLITPGVRPAGAAADDQRRTADPAEAVAAGATHLVVGRPITGADDPRAVYDGICEAIS